MLRKFLWRLLGHPPMVESDAARLVVEAMRKQRAAGMWLATDAALDMQKAFVAMGYPPEGVPVAYDFVPLDHHDKFVV